MNIDLSFLTEEDMKKILEIPHVKSAFLVHDTMTIEIKKEHLDKLITILEEIIQSKAPRIPRRG